MHDIGRKFLKCLGVVGLAVLSGMLCGCDNGGSTAIGDGHDFGANDSNIVAAFGDSITAGVDGSPSYAPILAGMIGKDVRNLGFPAMQSSFGRDRIGSVLSGRPGFVLVLFGANDVIMGIDGDVTINNLRDIVVACKNNLTIPVLTMLLPMIEGHEVYNGGVDLLNPMIQALAKEQDVPLADVNASFVGHPEYLISDGLHPSQAGAEAIARTYADLFL
ncbi:MAG: SGNH/GDSL hydrolase family protein [bacterium]